MAGTVAVAAAGAVIVSRSRSTPTTVTSSSSGGSSSADADTRDDGRSGGPRGSSGTADGSGFGGFGGSSGGGKATGNDFCDVLDAGYAELEKNQVDPNADAATQFVGAFGELGRYEKLLDQLADAAPPEIAYDMQKSRDTFEGAISDASGSANDPIGAMAKILMNSLIAEPSFEAVDKYAWTNCQKTVFGSPKQFQGSTTGTTAAAGRTGTTAHSGTTMRTGTTVHTKSTF